VSDFYESPLPPTSLGLDRRSGVRGTMSPI